MSEEPSSDSSNKEGGVNYVRKKNIISGVDNDLLLWGTGILALGVGIANLPQVQEALKNIFRPVQQQLQQQQMQPNNGSQQYLVPPPQQVQRQAQPAQDLSNPDQLMPSTQQLIQRNHDNAILQQEAYKKAVEADAQNSGGDHYNSLLAVHERGAEPKTKYKPYVPGSNVSAGL